MTGIPNLKLRISLLASLIRLAAALIVLIILLPEAALGQAGSTLAQGTTLIAQGPGTRFPIVINTPGVYRLATDLKIASVYSDALVITVSGVTLDLGGFSIIGPRSGSGAGINGAANTAAVLNGSVVGMGGAGILLGPQSDIENVRAIGNGGDGISAACCARIFGCIANNNRGSGIACGGPCVAPTPTPSFMFTGPGAVNSPMLAAGPAATVTGNTVSGNSRYGLLLNSTVGYGQNVIQNNAAGCVVSGISMSGNRCNGVSQ